MNDIKEELCYAMHKFVKEHIGEMTRPASDLCIEWKNEKQMLRDIRKNFSDAVWALGELLGDYPKTIARSCFWFALMKMRKVTTGIYAR